MDNKIKNDCLFIDINLIELLLMTPEGEAFVTGVKMIIRKYRVRNIGKEVSNCTKNGISWCQMTRTSNTNHAQCLPVTQSCNCCSPYKLNLGRKIETIIGNQLGTFQ